MRQRSHVATLRSQRTRNHHADLLGPSATIGCQREEPAMRRVTSIAAIALAAGCSSPATPSAPTPVQVAGVWAEKLTVTASSGGECFAADLQSTIGEYSDCTLSVVQNGSTLTATNDTGTDTCSWTGTAGS